MSLATQNQVAAALWQHLTATLATAAPDGGPIAVFDHIPTDPDQFHIRVDIPDANTRSTRDHDRDRLLIDVHVFDRPPALGGGRGRREVNRIGGLIEAALSRWQPLPAAAPLRKQGHTALTEPDGTTARLTLHYAIQLED